ncbi:hypothetical protein SDJN02_17931, partial [Cucurbita argyrosperma subsp. argyrosperma]
MLVVAAFIGAPTSSTPFEPEGGCSFKGKRRSNISSHCFTSVYSKSVATEAYSTHKELIQRHVATISRSQVSKEIIMCRKNIKKHKVHQF